MHAGKDSGIVLFSGGARYWFPCEPAVFDRSLSRHDWGVDPSQFLGVPGADKLFDADDARWCYFRDGVNHAGVRAEDWRPDDDPEDAVEQVVLSDVPDQDPHADRRLALVVVPEQVIYDLICGLDATRVRYRLVLTHPLVPGAVVEAVHVDFYSKCFVFRVRHPSLPPVPDGDVFPRLDGIGCFEWREVPDCPPGFVKKFGDRGQVIYEQVVIRLPE